MLALIWHPEALDDLENILDFIEVQNPSAAGRIGEAIRHTAGQLPNHPYMYRTGRVPGTREALVTPNYILVYRVAAHAIEILAVKHTRQQYP
ncbi:type II toxin-antitoxin system RelE/ParE family toxin [Sphingobium phenoxybenzoativorans]|uniref:Type II toxin-antitoxin system RelE/ParE family toxin n=1 Tax=Sphingobium phenoxybenzoativorans TaxID=1592790 RepID=A0A975K6C6_9SPHN|nr:type II toxin-antitoxin system RelE/ParE family toxin [Sphingobium phenoxybenzoativorans]QUT05297.1 type II toxin-antitoxin system RelE/ParE family toxin [Sphingobium phenoxybenzoativorans]